VCGNFDDSFLELPEKVLITVMKEHQKYFAVQDKNDRLIPNFIAINNTVARDESVVREGHERVLRARLSDARFFFAEDRKNKLADRLEDLKHVIYQTELGTSYEKVQRFTKLAIRLGKQLIPDKMEQLKIASGLCKCDLVTQMVTEFPGLQGIIGREYSRIEGYPEEICSAIYEHYLPTKAEGDLPTSKIGAVVGIADRMDTIVGCFSVGLEPTGSADPFALRRHAIAIIRIIEKMEWDLSLEEFIKKAISILKRGIKLKEEIVLGKVKDFFQERYRQIMMRSGFEADIVEAVISTQFDRINQLGVRMDHLKKFRSTTDDFEALALTFKRIANILKKQDSSLQVNTSLFVESCEKRLWETYQRLEKAIPENLLKKDFLKALELLAQFREPVDEFFDGVEILTKENEKLRKNRINLLQKVADLFLSVADLSKFSI
jgi:glycyl-tRNA synthetase beta chain